MSSYCEGCGRTFNGSRGLAIHRGKTGCGKQSNSRSCSSTLSSCDLGISRNSSKLVDNYINCDVCGKQCKGQRGLSIHKAKSVCGFTKNFSESSTCSYQSDNSVNYENCGKQCKGQHGLSIHKVKSNCDSVSTDSYQPINWLNCDVCGKQCKGQRGLSIHKAKSVCGFTKNFSESSTGSYQSDNSVYCENCGKQCKGQHGLSIHKVKSNCDSVSTDSYQPINRLNCDVCGKQCKGQRGLSIHKAKSVCGFTKNFSESSTCSYQSNNSVNCENCGKQYKGQHGLSIHKAISICGSSSSSCETLSSSLSTSTIEQRVEDFGYCDSCGQIFKDKKGLMIHRTKSRCGRIIPQHITCRHRLNDLKLEDLLNINYDQSIYDPGKRLGLIEKHISNEIIKNDVSKNLESIYWPEYDIVLNNKIDIEEQFYRDIINETIQNSNDWRMNLKTFKDRLQSAFNKELYIDAEFIVIYEKENKIIKGHKLIFALASTVFRAMFYGSLPEKNKVTIKDVSPRAMQNILLFLYTNSIIYNNIDDAINTHYAAKKYILNNLQCRTMKYLENNVNCENNFQIFEYSELMELNDLKEKCERIMNKNSEKCLRSGYFLNMNLDSVMKIAAWYMERNLQNRLLAEKLVEWSMAECEMQEFYKTEENLNSLLEPILDKIGSESFAILVRSIVGQYADY